MTATVAIHVDFGGSDGIIDFPAIKNGLHSFFYCRMGSSLISTLYLESRFLKFTIYYIFDNPKTIAVGVYI